MTAARDPEFSVFHGPRGPSNSDQTDSRAAETPVWTFPRGRLSKPRLDNPLSGSASRAGSDKVTHPNLSASYPRAGEPPLLPVSIFARAYQDKSRRHAFHATLC